jgi:hypothetical protein
VAKKRQQRSTTRKGPSKLSKAVRRPAAKSAAKASKLPVKASVTRTSKQIVASARPVPAPVGPSFTERAEHLLDEILRSKLTHPHPWSYAPKARSWGERAQMLVEQIEARGDTPAARRSLEALDAELRGDRDFQEARRLF